MVCAEGPVEGDIDYAGRCIFVTILAGQTSDTVIDLSAVPWLNGVVRDAVTDAPIADASVTVSQFGQQLWAGLTNNQGEFTVTADDGLTDGTVQIQVTAFNYDGVDEDVSYQAAVDVLDGWLDDSPVAGEGTYDATLLLGLTMAEVQLFGQVDCNSDTTVDDSTVNTLANTNASCSDIPSPTAAGDDTAGQSFGGLNVTASQILVFETENPLVTDTPLFTRAIVPPTGGNSFAVTAGQSYTFCIFYEEDGDSAPGGTGDEDFVCTAFTQVDETGFSNASDKLTLQLLGSTRVVSTEPADGATNVSVNQVITITFNRPAEIASAAAFSLECPSGTPIGFTVTNPALLPATSTSFTLTPSGPLPEGVTCTVTVLSGQVPDMLADYSFSFTTNIAPFVQSTNPLDGAVNVATNQVITIVFSEPVDATAAAFTLECPVATPIAFTSTPALPATNTTMYELTPSVSLPEGVTCTVTVVAAEITATDGVAPVNMAADYGFSFTTDQAPTVLSTVPTDGSGVGPGSQITIQFSEPVNVTATAFDLQCPTGTPIALSIDPAAPGGVADYTLTPTGGLPPGVLCTMTVVAAQVTDVDSGDPPNNMAADNVFNFNVDAPPEVVDTTPADGATGVAAGASITINFSEPVNVTATAFTLECPVGSAVAFTVAPVPPGGVASFVLDPTADLPLSTTCTVTVVAAQVSDVDMVDPPDTMLADYVFSFTTTDPAPEVVNTAPLDGGGIGPDGTITIEFSEAVNVTATAFELICGVDPVTLTIDPAPPGGVTTFTLTPTSPLPAGASCTMTVVADQVSDADTVDPPDNMAADYVFSFNIDAPPEVESTTPADGATDVAVDATISITFSEPVNVTATAFTLECPSGAAVALTNTTANPATTFTLDPDVDLPQSTVCDVTVTASQVSDADSIDPPDTMLADYSFSFTTTDPAPFVVDTTPDENGGIGPTGTITIQFSEPVNVTAAAFELVCTVSGTVAVDIAPLPPGGVTTYVLTPAGGLSGGESCALTVVADQVSDLDGIDPANMAADFVLNFNVDAAPEVDSTTPANGAADVAVDTNISITFNEAVNVTATAFVLECPVSVPVALTNVTGTGPATTFDLNPNTNLPNGVVCTVTVAAAQVTDDDALDPPNNMEADYVFSFTTIDLAPTVVSTVPTDAATGVATNTSITINFSEPVNVTATAFTLECPVGAAQALTVTPAPPGGAAGFTLDPTADLPGGVTCTVTVVATQVTDADPVDPPDQMAANYVFTFTTDSPPSVTSTVPVDGADDVLPDAVITINFSESVNATTASFTIECPVGTDISFALSASPNASFTLTPDADLPAGETCTVTVIADQITDADTNDPPDQMLADFVFSFSIPLVAADLTYTPTIVGNVGINTANSTNYSLITENGIPNVTANLVSAASANGGTVTLDSVTGTFTYNPPAGFTGTDTFQYTLTGGSGTSAPATVTLTVAGMVWFVNNTAAAGGDGRLTNPFNCLVGGGSCLVAASGGSRGAAGHVLFIYTGSGAYTAGLTLLNNQRLIGQGATADFVTASGLTFPADIVTLPATGGADPLLTTANVDAVQLTSGATANLITGLTIGNTGTGYAISGTNFGTLTVSDVTISGTGGALNLSTGTLAATFESITSTGSATIGINLTSVGGTLAVTGATTMTDPSNQGLNLTTSSVAITMASLTVTDATVAINLQTQTGVVTINGGAISGSSGNAVNISSGNANFTYAGSITNTTASAFSVRLSGRGTGTVTFSGAISDTGMGIAVLDSTSAVVVFSGASKVLNTGANPAVTLTNNASSTISFTNGGLDIDTNGALAFSATVAGAVVVSGSGNSITAVNAQALLLNAVAIGAGDVLFDSVSSSGASAGPAVQFVSVTGAGELITITTLTINGTTSGMDGVDIDNVAANVVITGGSITGVSGIDFDVNSGAGNVSYGGTITNTSNRSVEVTARATNGSTTTFSGAISDTATGILVQNNSNGAAITFSGASKTITMTGATQAVTLLNNTGATISFTNGGLVIVTDDGNGLNATGGGTLVVTGTGNTSTATGGIALNVSGVTIGASGLTFQRISANGGAAGIVLSSTGASGGLTVTGTGAAGTGGVITNITSRGASFMSAVNISLTNMTFTNAATTDGSPCMALSLGTNTGCNAPLNIQDVTNATLASITITNSAQQGINGRNVTNFSLSNSTITGIGNAADEDGIHFFNMLGTSSITNTSVTGSFDDNMIIQSQSGAGTLTVTGGTFSNSLQGSGIILGPRGTSTMTVNVSGVTFNDNFSGGLPADAFDTATMNLSVTDSTFTANNDGIQVSAGQTAVATFDIFDNNFSGNDFLAINLLKAAFSTGGVLEGRIRDNTITIANGRPADAIFVFQAGGGALNAEITGNTINYAGTQRAIVFQAGQDGNGTLDATVTGNTIDIQLDGTGNAVTGVFAQNAVVGATPPDPPVTTAMCVDIGGAGALQNTFTHSLGGTLAAGDIRVRQRFDGTVRLPGYAGGALDTAAVIAYLDGRNIEVSPSTATAETTGFAGGGACTAP